MRPHVSLTRRGFLLTMLAGGAVLATACRGENRTAGAITRVTPPDTPTPSASLPFPRATPTPTLIPLAPLSARRPDEARQPEARQPEAVTQARFAPYVAKTLPPVRLIVPSIGLDSKIIPIGMRYDRTGALAWETAAFAVGHMRDSANPGAAGNMVLSGHISSPNEGAIFRRLPEVKPADVLIVATDAQQYLYRVRDTQVVEPKRIEYLHQTPAPIATLLTCVPDGIYSHRLVVRADAV